MDLHEPRLQAEVSRPSAHLCLVDDHRGAPLPVVQQHLGHESIEVTIEM